MEILNPYAGGLAESDHRPDAIATISAGYKETRKNARGEDITVPVVSRDGKIILHDDKKRAPGLKAALELTGYKMLTIAFPVNDVDKFLQSRFAARKSGRLTVYGDQYQVTEIVLLDDKGGATHVSHPAGSERYIELAKTCKVETSVFFTLAEWDTAGQTSVIFPDGFGLYRLRFTSLNSLRNFHNQVAMLQSFTTNQIAGIPIDLFIDYRDVPAPDGKSRNVPVFCLGVRPPEQIKLTSRNFKQIMGAAVDQGAALMLPAPGEITIDSIELDDNDLDIDEVDDSAAAAIINPLCDAQHYRQSFFYAAKDSVFANDDQRHELVAAATNGQFNSLEQFLAQATDKQAADFLSFALQHIEESKNKYGDNNIETENLLEKLRSKRVQLFSTKDEWLDFLTSTTNRTVLSECDENDLGTLLVVMDGMLDAAAEAVAEAAAEELQPADPYADEPATIPDDRKEQEEMLRQALTQLGCDSNAKMVLWMKDHGFPISSPERATDENLFKALVIANDLVEAMEATNE